MQSIDSIYKQVGKDGDIKAIRISIIDLIEHHLQETKEKFGYWEKEFLSRAIASLSVNITSPHQPNVIWLRLSLGYIEKSTTLSPTP